MSEVQQVLFILLYKYGVNFTALMIIVFKLTMFIILCFSPDTFIKGC